MVAEKLDKKLRENLRDTRNSLFMMDASQAGNYRYSSFGCFFCLFFFALNSMQQFVKMYFFFSFQRPLLIILDRNVDMATPLHHTWTYQALAHDVLDLALNRVVVEENAGRSPAGGAKAKTRACDLDSKDRFWMTHKGRCVDFSPFARFNPVTISRYDSLNLLLSSPFPTVAEAIQEELEEYRSSEVEVKKLKASMVGILTRLFHLYFSFKLL